MSNVHITEKKYLFLIRIKKHKVHNIHHGRSATDSPDMCGFPKIPSTNTPIHVHKCSIHTKLKVNALPPLSMHRRELKLFKKRFRLNVRKYAFRTELLITGICCLPAALIVRARSVWIFQFRFDYVRFLISSTLLWFFGFGIHTTPHARVS